MLKVEGVSKQFGGVYANRDISLDVAEGELRGVIGPNGAGKSTLFNLIAGHLRPDAGSISLAGARIDRLPPHVRSRRGVAIVFQGARLFAGMSLLQNVMVGAHAHSRAGLVVRRAPPARPTPGGAGDPGPGRAVPGPRRPARACGPTGRRTAAGPAAPTPVGARTGRPAAAAAARRAGLRPSGGRAYAARRPGPRAERSRARPSSSSSTTSAWSPRWPSASRCWTSAR